MEQPRVIPETPADDARREPLSQKDSAVDIAAFALLVASAVLFAVSVQKGDPHNSSTSTAHVKPLDKESKSFYADLQRIDQERIRIFLRQNDPNQIRDMIELGKVAAKMGEGREDLFRRNPRMRFEFQQTLVRIEEGICVLRNPQGKADGPHL